MSISRIVFAGRDASGNANLGVTTRISAGSSELAVAGANAGGLFNSNKFSSGFTPGFTVLGNRALFEGDDASGAASLWVTRHCARFHRPRQQGVVCGPGRDW